MDSNTADFQFSIPNYSQTPSAHQKKLKKSASQLDKKVPRLSDKVAPNNTNFKAKYKAKSVKKFLDKAAKECQKANKVTERVLGPPRKQIQFDRLNDHINSRLLQHSLHNIASTPDIDMLDPKDLMEIEDLMEIDTDTNIDDSMIIDVVDAAVENTYPNLSVDNVDTLNLLGLSIFDPESSEEGQLENDIEMFDGCLPENDAEMRDEEKLENNFHTPTTEEFEGAFSPLEEGQVESESYESVATHSKASIGELFAREANKVESSQKILRNKVKKRDSSLDEIKKLRKLAEECYKKGDYNEAYMCFLQIGRKVPTDDEILEKTAKCLEKLERYQESLLIYRTLVKKNPKNSFYLKKIADCLFGSQDYLRAKIVYKKLLSMEHRFEETVLQSRIAECSKRLRSNDQWPSYDELARKIGLNGGPLTNSQLNEIDSLNRALIHKHQLVWELFLRPTRSLSEEYVRKNFYPVPLKSKDGRTFTAYRNPNYKFLGHFSNLTNSAKILDNEVRAQHDPSIKEQDSYFWNSQYKVCTSLFKEGDLTFFSGAMHQEGLGFIIDVPDPDKNILHAFSRDTWTPTYIKQSSGASSVTSVGAEDDAREYNDFMLRYQALSQYVYTISQNAEKEIYYLKLLESMQQIQKILQDKVDHGLIQKIITSVVSFFKQFVGDIDVTKKEIEDIAQKIDVIINSAQFTPETEAQVLQMLAHLKETFQSMNKNSEATVIDEHSEAVSKGFATSYLPEPELITSPKVFDDTSNLLILSYLDKSIQSLEPVLARFPHLEKTLFEKILNRTPENSESLIRTLQDMRNKIKSVCEKAYPKVHKMKTSISNDYAIFSRPLTPQEVMQATAKGKYSEIGVRSNFASHSVQGKGASFKGVIVERAVIKNSRISNEMADLLEKAQKAHLPIIYI